MFFIANFITIIGTTIAGLWDLKTTEVPDEIPLLLSSFGIFIWFLYGSATGNFSLLTESIINGSLFLMIGYLLYKAGHWGGADAAILGSIFYLMPRLDILVFIINFLIVSFAYMFVYTIAIGIKNKKLFFMFAHEIRKNALYVILVTAFSVLIALSFPAMRNLMFFLLFTTIFIIYAKIIEKKYFLRTISTKKLKIGDVLYSSKEWKGITEKEMKKIKKSKKRVKIKEGVRLVLVFPLTIIATELLGNLFIILFF